MQKRHLLTIIFALLFMQAGLVQAAQKLVESDWLGNNLGKQNMVLIDMSDDLQYQRFHLPGAISLPYGYLVQSQKGVSLSIGQSNLVKLLGQIGISAESYVIAYDDTGGLHAARLLWELEQLGHKNMAMLNGGLVKWIREGRKISFDVPKIQPTKYEHKAAGVSAVATLADVTAADNKAVIIDVRSPEEYQGDPKFPRSGHVPGARSWPWDTALNTDGGFTLHDHKTLQAELGKIGLGDTKQPLILYCQSGHRAAHSYFTLRELGYENVRVYDGSMKEYGARKELPLTKGNKP